MSGAGFATRLCAWASEHGRTGLPWQAGEGEVADPYRIWISEIMLQQTQVATVIPYFERFMASFPDVATLAAAPRDEVLARWAGLGYYSRARNLHEAARQVMAEHGGEIPDEGRALEALPGIGPSTAAAILSLGFDRPAPVLDGNVKRVLARHAGVDGWPGRSPVLRRLRAEAEARLPATGAAAYSQAIMDLGATVCTPAAPDCGACPVSADCVALADGRVEELPERRPRRRVPVRATWMLLLQAADGSVLLERRPPSGIWGGLWSLPEMEDEATAVRWIRRRFGSGSIGDRQQLASFRHTFSHYHLDIHPLMISLQRAAAGAVGDDELAWVRPDSLDELGLAAPVRRLVEGVLGGGISDRGNVQQAERGRA